MKPAAKPDVLTVTVKIMGREYAVQCAPNEHEALVTSAEILNERMNAIKKRGRALGAEKIAVMAALNLTRELLGEPIPVAALFDWLQGRPWGAVPHQRTDKGFEQMGWRIEPRLPALVATRLADPVVTLRARLEGSDEGTP